MAVASRSQPLPQPLLRASLISVSPWLVLVILALGEFMILLDTTIVNVALPGMAADLHASGAQILWVVNAYTLTFAALLIPAGRLGAMLGPRRLFLGGLALFTLASLACALSQSPGELVACRVLQAAGGAALTPQTLSIITALFPPEKRGAAFGVWGAVYGLGGISGPLLGGILTTAFSWRAIFVPNLPVGILAILFAALTMPELTTRRRHQLDLVGVGLAAFGLLALIFGLIEGQSYGWGRIADVGALDLGPVHAGLVSIPACFLTAGVLLIGFVWWEARQEEPVLPLSLFRDRNYALGCVISAVQVFGMTGLFLPLVIYLQTGLHLTPLQAGLTILPNALGSVAVTPLVGRVADRVNPKALLIAGLSLYAGGMALLSHLASATASGFTFAPALLVIGLGVGLTFAPMTTLTMQSIVPSAAGAASGFMNTARQVGSVLGATMGGAILLGRIGTEAHQQAAQATLQVPTPYRRAFAASLAQALRHLDVGGAAHLTFPATIPAASHATLAALGRAVVSQAFTDAVRPAFLVPLVMALGGAALTTTMRSPRRQDAAETPLAEPTGAEPPPLAASFASLDPATTLVLPATIARSGAPARPIRPPSLVRIGDPAHTEYPIRRRLILGRRANSGIVLHDPRASRRHAEVAQRADGVLVLRDLQSANGTLLNGRNVHGEHRLHAGDTITVGATTFRVHHELERVRPRLLRTDGSHQTVYPLGCGLVLGRLPDNPVTVADPLVSRRHAAVRAADGVVTIRDLNSLNGTRVNGELVVGDRPLQPGDVIAVGTARFTYHTDVEAASGVP